MNPQLIMQLLQSNPEMMGTLFTGAGTNPEAFAQIADAQQFPLPGTPEFAELLNPGGGLGEALSGGPPPVTTSMPPGGATSPLGTADIMRRIAPRHGAMPPAMATMGAPGGAPPGTVPAMQTTGARPSGQMPNIKPPTPVQPEFRAGVTGAQKAPEMSGAPGNMQQALLAMMMGGGGQKQQNPLRVPPLGALFG